MKEGYSVKAFAGHIGVNYSTVYEWAENHPEFSDAVKDGQAAAAEWWEKTLRNVAAKGEGNASAAIFGVKNRSQEEWRDKVETDHTSSDGTMTPQVIDASGLSDAALQELMNARKRAETE